jgi:hypothetical protein
MTLREDIDQLRRKIGRLRAWNSFYLAIPGFRGRAERRHIQLNQLEGDLDDAERKLAAARDRGIERHFRS